MNRRAKPKGRMAPLSTSVCSWHGLAAARVGTLFLLAMLSLAAGEDAGSASAADALGMTALHRAILVADDEEAMRATRELLERGVEINALDTFGNTPLHGAVLTASRPLVRHLLSAGADVDLPGADGATPLFRAVEAGRRGIVEELLSAGADATLPNAAGVSAQELAMRSPDPDIRRLFSSQVDETGLKAEAIVTSIMGESRLNAATLTAAVTQLDGLDPDALPPLVRILEDASLPVSDRRRAALVLGRLGRDEAAAPLFEILRRGERGLAREVANALKELASPAHAMDLCHYLRDANPQDHQLRWTLYETLGAAKNPETLPFLMHAQANEVHPGCRERATLAINAILETDVGPTAQMRWIRENRPKWLSYFKEQTTTHPGYQKIALYFAIGVGLSILAVWFLFSRI